MATLHKKISKLMAEPSECAFYRDQLPVCSPRAVVNKMISFAKAKGATLPTRHKGHKSAERPSSKYGKNEPSKDDRRNVEGVDEQDASTGSTQKVDAEAQAALEAAKKILDCNTESCVLKRPEFIQFAQLANVQNLLDEFFKPQGPATHFGLLSNFNIDEVLDQLAIKHKDFLHIPYQMRDFEKKKAELSTVNLTEQFKSGINKFGVVLNTDWYSGRGIHWYCIFGEKTGDRITIEYFNSSGRDPLVETQAWLHKTKHQLTKDLNIPVDIKYSTGIVFQNDEHSCGIYCLMYIWLRLEGIEHNQFKAQNFHDAIMHKARRLVFRHEV